MNRSTNSTIRDKLEDELEDKLEVNLEDEYEEKTSRIFDSTLNNCLLGWYGATNDRFGSGVTNNIVFERDNRNRTGPCMRRRC